MFHTCRFTSKALLLVIGAITGYVLAYILSGTSSRFFIAITLSLPFVVAMLVGIAKTTTA